MPIVIKPKMSKMDKMGAGGMDIGRTPSLNRQDYDKPGIEKNPTLKKKMNKMAGKMEDMREYMDILDDIEEDTLDEGSVKDMMQDVEEGMTKEEFEKAYPGMGSQYDKIKKEIMDRQDEDTTTEEVVDEGKVKDMMMAWTEKYSNYIGNNGDPLPQGYVQWATNSGITTDAMETNEVDAMMKKYGEDKFEEDPMAFIDEMPITKAYMNELVKITGTDDIEDNAETIEMFIESDTTENIDIEVEEDCGCDQEAVDAMVSVPVQELQDILQLAGYENYAEKIAEYANEPAEDYMSPEDQLIGLSGGLNRPKKSYPASAPGDNPMDQEPREVEETMEAVEEKLYKSYKDFLEEAEITNKD